MRDDVFTLTLLYLGVANITFRLYDLPQLIKSYQSTLISAITYYLTYHDNDQISSAFGSTIVSIYISTITILKKDEEQ